MGSRADSLRDGLSAAPLRRVPPSVRLLLGCEVGFNLGFYMLVPFIAGELHGRGMAAAVVGLVLGLRTLSQQGLFLAGGWAADRLGAKPAIVAGCLLRTVGFALFAVSRSAGALLAAAVMSGAAAALFTPAMRAWMAADAGSARPQTFALAAMASQVGALAGPLFGAVLLRSGFATVALAASAVFLVFSILLLIRLPATARPRERAVADAFATTLRNRRFLVFVGAMAGYAVLFNQLYLLLPLAFSEATRSPGATAWLFALSAVLVLLLQGPITRACARRWQPLPATSRGLAVMGLAFGPCALAQASAARPGSALMAAAVVAATAVLTLGMMMAHPFAMELVPALAGERALGLHYGLYYAAGGIAATAGSALAGLAYDRASGASGGPLIWMALAAVGLTGGYILRRLERTARLESPA